MNNEELMISELEKEIASLKEENGILRGKLKGTKDLLTISKESNCRSAHLIEFIRILCENH